MMDRMSEALERIATALERTADADPLAMFNDAFGAGGDPFADYAEPQAPIASNGQTILYALPVTDWQVVARKDRGEESGYRVSIESVEE